MKHLLKFIILYLSYLFRRDRKSKVIYYHDLGTAYTDMGTDLSLFFEHLSIISKAGFEIVDKITQLSNQIMICFDDGWKGIYDHKDVFVGKGIHPTVFIAVDLIGKDGYLSKSQIEELYSLGFDFQCHSWSHKDLTSFSESELRHELLDSKLCLERLFGHSFDSICYPQGRFSAKVYNMCLEIEYKYQYSSICGGYYDLFEKKIVCRNCVQYSSPTEFKMFIMSSSSLMKRHFKSMHYSN